MQIPADVFYTFYIFCVIGTIIPVLKIYTTAKNYNQINPEKKQTNLHYWCKQLKPSERKLLPSPFLLILRPPPVRSLLYSK